MADFGAPAHLSFRTFQKDLSGLSISGGFGSIVVNKEDPNLGVVFQTHEVQLWSRNSADNTFPGSFAARGVALETAFVTCTHPVSEIGHYSCAAELDAANVQLKYSQRQK